MLKVICILTENFPVSRGNFAEHSNSRQNTVTVNPNVSRIFDFDGFISRKIAAMVSRPQGPTEARKSVQKFLRKVASRQIDKQTNKQTTTSTPEVSPDEGFQREAETSINSMLFWLY